MVASGRMAAAGLFMAFLSLAGCTGWAASYNTCLAVVVGVNAGTALLGSITVMMFISEYRWR